MRSLTHTHISILFGHTPSRLHTYSLAHIPVHKLTRSYIDSLACTLTQSLAHTLTKSLARILMKSLARALTHPHTHALAHLRTLTHSRTHAPARTRALTLPHPCSLTHPHVRALTTHANSFTHMYISICSHANCSTRSFAHSHTRSHTHILPCSHKRTHTFTRLHLFTEDFLLELFLAKLRGLHAHLHILSTIRNSALTKATSDLTRNMLNYGCQVAAMRPSDK